MFGIQYARIMFLACQHLINGAVELSEIHILLKIKLEWIDCQLQSLLQKMIVEKIDERQCWIANLMMGH